MLKAVVLLAQVRSRPPSAFHPTRNHPGQGHPADIAVHERVHILLSRGSEISGHYFE